MRSFRFPTNSIFSASAFLFMAGLGHLQTSAAPATEAAPRRTHVSISGDKFLINGQPTYAGRVWQGQPIEGLLLNTRMVQGIYDDLNLETRPRWAYPDTGKWDPDRNTHEFIAAMPEWKKHGILAFTLNLQGGSPQGYSKEQPWINSAFAPDGSMREEYMVRLTQILDEADRLGLVVILGYFYFGQDERVTHEAGVKHAVDNATQWVLDHGYANVLIELNNECDVKEYDHAILKPNRVSELITRAKALTHEGKHLLVGTSFTGGTVPTDNVLAASDFVLLHGNGKNDPARIHKMVQGTRARSAWHIMPIVFNEDDHFDFEKPENHFLTALSENASWGYFDPGESNYRDGYQCPPVNWRINTPRKQAFFKLVGEITGAEKTAATALDSAPPHWTRVTPAQGTFSPREECALVETDGRFYLLGGRQIKPVDIYDPKAQAWSHGAPPPVEMHHFQAVVWAQRVYVTCAMTGKYPTEKPIDRILIYDTAKDSWSWGDSIPVARRRGSAGAVIVEGKLFLICGIQNGHTDGWVNWCDTYDLKTGEWATLPDAPRARDHFEAAAIGGKIYAAGGRRSSAITKQVFDLTIPEVDVYNIATKTWTTLPPTSNLLIQRAGTTTLALGNELLVCGGESMSQKPAHAEIQAWNTQTGTWRDLPGLLQGRHGTSVVLFGNALWVCAGAGERGGSPLLATMETLDLTPMRLP